MNTAELYSCWIEQTMKQNLAYMNHFKKVGVALRVLLFSTMCPQCLATAFLGVGVAPQAGPRWPQPGETCLRWPLGMSFSREEARRPDPTGLESLGALDTGRNRDVAWASPGSAHNAKQVGARRAFPSLCQRGRVQEPVPGPSLEPQRESRKPPEGRARRRSRA